MKPVRNSRNANKRAAAQKDKPVIKDPIEVYCRIRPLENENELVCIKKKDNDDKTVVMSPPDASISLRCGTKEVHYSFKHVFDENTSQKMIFNSLALPLIQNLFQGINGLLFTYGITSSGKTFTVTGTPQDPGILPRSLDVILNSMKNFQSKKCVFKSDKFNGFDIQSPEEAYTEYRAEIGAKSRQRNKKEYIGEWSARVPETAVVRDINSDCRYAAFISYVEIYNNYIYDLLEDPSSDTYPKMRAPQSKMLREDATHNSYVFNTTELEVETADEALELFCKGQQRRRISHTSLNAKSSRSHSVFTVRIVQAPLDVRGSEIIQDKNLLTISQLSMVDLAGSERLIRTRNTGKQQQETGNINTSLMALRKCIEVLRENQKQNNPKMVPYRESKLTQLFKTYFEGEGKIRMVVCVNPHIDDFYETTFVMQFAEVSQDVLIHRGMTPVKTPVHLTLRSGRGKQFMDAVNKAHEEDVPLETVLDPVVYSLGPDFPSLVISNSDGDASFSSIIEYLNSRKARRESLHQHLIQKQNDFRQSLVKIERENLSLKQDNSILQMDLKAREQQVRDLERKLSSAYDERHLLKEKLGSAETRENIMKNKLNEHENLLSAGEREKEKIKTKMHDKIQFEKDRMRRMMGKRLAEKQAELERKMCFSEDKFRQLREILNSGDWELGADFFSILPAQTAAKTVAAPPDMRLTRAKTTMDVEDIHRHKPSSVSSQVKAKSVPQVSQATAVTFKMPQKSIAVANPRHRRSQSSSGNVWLEHKPIGNLELGTVLQPKMKKKKSVSKLEVKDVTKSDVSKYVLTHQEQDSQGELETKLYKADVIPSAGGGAQVIFNDVEKLRQESPPPTYNLRKRSAEEMTLKDIEQKCTVSVECHGIPSKVQRKAK